MRTAKILGSATALIAAALIGGTIISAVAAQSPTASPSAAAGKGAAAKYCDTFRSKLASELGVDVGKLDTAIAAAASGTIDEAVKNGDLSKAIADKLKARISGATDQPCFGLGARGLGKGPAFARGFAHGFGAGDLLGAAAGAFGMQTSDLATQLHDGKSLKDVATAKGVAYAKVSTAVTNAAKAELDKAVSGGRITQQREDQMLADLRSALEAGTWPGMKGHGMGLRGWMGGPR